MLDTLVNFVFYIITTLYDILLSPFFSLIYALFPSINTYFIYINNFLDLALTYFINATKFMFIPNAALVLLFDYFLIKYSIYIIRITIRLGIKIYNIFKP